MDHIDINPRPGTLFDGALHRGDRLVRFAPHEGILHSALVVSDRVESAASLLRRGVEVECAGPGGYVEVAETAFDGGEPRHVGRLLTDAWGRLARGQTIVRSRPPARPSASTAPAPEPAAAPAPPQTAEPLPKPPLAEPEPAAEPAAEPMAEPATAPAIDAPLAEAPAPQGGSSVVKRRIPQGFFARKFDEFINARRQQLVQVRIHDNVATLTFAKDLADLHGLKPVSFPLGHLEAELPWLPNPNIKIKDLNSSRVTAGATRIADTASPGGRALALVLDITFETKGTELELNNFGDIDLQQLDIHVELVLVRGAVDGRGAIGFRPQVRADVKATLNWGPDGIARRKVKQTIERKLAAGLADPRFQQRAARALTRWLAGGPWEVRSLDLVGDELVVGYVEPPRHELVQVFAETPQKPLTVGALSKVDHIVVLMMENRSFDHMLGYLSLTGGRRDIDGLTGKEVNRWKGRDWRPFHLTDTVFDHDPCHGRDCVQTQMAGGMGGFVANFAAGLKSGRISPGEIMGYYDGKDLPVYDVLAREFAVCDRWFAAHPGPTFPNRFYTLTGRLARDQFGNTVYQNPDMVTYSPTQSKSIFDHLSQRGVSWRYYEHGYGFLRLFHRWVTDTAAVQPAADFFAAAAAGTLPSVSYIDPDFIEYPPANDDHAPADVRDGQRLIARIVNALMKGPAWQRTLLLVTYDEHGGFYDHVVPPAAIDVSGVNEYGVRVPTLVVSPWIERGTVSHTVYDHTSILKTIIRRFCAANPPDLGARVVAAADVGALLTRAKPRTDVPLIVVPSASTAGPPKAPGEGAEADPRAGAGSPSLRDFHALLATTRARYAPAATAGVAAHR